MRDDFVEELIIWRPIMEQLVTLSEVKSGQVDIVDLMKINALMDMRSASEQHATEQAQRGTR